MALENNIEKCSVCTGNLVDYDDYLMKRAVRRMTAGALVAAVTCAVWAPLFFIVRLGIGGALGDAGAGILGALVLKKILVGIILGALLGVSIGIGGNDIGLFLGAVVGALGGFFIAAADVMPLQSNAAHRVDVVLVSVIAGILCVLTVAFTENYLKRRFGKWTGPTPRAMAEAGDGE